MGLTCSMGLWDSEGACRNFAIACYGLRDLFVEFISAGRTTERCQKTLLSKNVGRKMISGSKVRKFFAPHFSTDYLLDFSFDLSCFRSVVRANNKSRVSPKVTGSCFLSPKFICQFKNLVSVFLSVTSFLQGKTFRNEKVTHPENANDQKQSSQSKCPE